MKIYAIRLLNWFIRDTPGDPAMERLDQHVVQGDVFPYLATLTGFLSEATDQKTRDALSTEVRGALIHLHEQYELERAKKPISYTKTPSIRFS